jgi:hypothetical protein
MHDYKRYEMFVNQDFEFVDFFIIIVPCYEIKK